jgi:hypothetical protein
MEPEGSLPCSQESSTGPYPEPDQSSPYTPSFLSKIILILSIQLRLGLPSGLFPSCFPTNILQTFLFSPLSCYMPCPSHPPDFIILIIPHKDHKLWSSTLCSFPQPPVTSSLFSPNILLSILFSKTLSLCSFLNVRDQVSHPYRTTGKIIVCTVSNTGIYCSMTKLVQFT